MTERASGAVAALALLAILLFAPVAFGLAENWSSFTAFGAVFLLAMAWLPVTVLWHEGAVNRGTLSWSYRVLVGLAALSVLWSINRNLSVKQAIYWLAAYLVFFISANLKASRGVVLGVLWVLVILAAALSVYGLVMVLTGTPMVLNAVKTAYRNAVTATFVNKNHFAGYLEMMIFVTLGLLLTLKKKLLRPVLGLFLVLELAALLLTLSAGGIASFVLSLILVLALLLRRYVDGWKLAWVALPVVLSLVVGGVIGHRSLRQKVEDLAVGQEEEGEPSLSLSARLSLYESTLRIFRDHWTAGTGAGTFVSAFPPYRHADIVRRVDRAHNEYLEIMGELGVAGILAAVACIVGYFRLVLRRIHGRKDRSVQILASCLLGGVLSLLIHSFVDFNLRIPANGLTFACLAGLALYLASTSFHRHSGPTPAFGTESMAFKTRRARAWQAAVSVLALGGLLAYCACVVKADRLYNAAYRAFVSLKWDQAIEDYGRAIRLDPVVATFRSGQGYCYLNKAKFVPDADKKGEYLRKALARFKEAERLNPGNGDYNLNQAWAYKFLGQVDLEKASLDRMLRKDPNNAAYLYQYASFLIHRGGDPEKGIALFKKAFTVYPKLFSEKIHELYGEIPEYEKIAPLVPPTAGEHFIFASFLSVQAQWEAAVKEMDKTMALARGEPRYLREFARLLSRGHRFEAAINRLRAIPEGSRIQEDYEMEAAYLADLERWDECFAVMDSAIRRFPDVEGLTIAYARLLARSGSPAKGAERLAALAASGKAGPEVHAELAEALWQSGDRAGGINAMAKAVELAPGRAEFRYRIADFHVAVRNYGAAEKELTAWKQLHQGKEDLTTNLRLLTIYRRTGETDRFEECCGEIRRMAPRHPVLKECPEEPAAAVAPGAGP